MAQDNGENFTGCVLSIWHLIVTGPMWLILLFAIMSANDMPTWAWVLYWVYVPSSIIGIILAGAMRLLRQS